MESSVSIRRIQPGEGALFKKVRLASLLESPDAFATSYHSATLRTAASWSQQADDSASGSRRATFLAMEGGTPVGIASLYQDEEIENVGLLLQVWVSPDHRGTGLAGRLIDQLRDWAITNGYRRIEAEVSRPNKRALAFYRSYGFCGELVLTETDTLLLDLTLVADPDRR